MSIKGIGKELAIGKKRIHVMDFLANDTAVDYDEMKHINYCFPRLKFMGYMEFVRNDNKIVRFEFNKKANDAMERAVKFISEQAPDLEMINFDNEQNYKTISLMTNLGAKELGAKTNVINISQMPDERVFINNSKSIFYHLVDYDWNGSIFDTVTTMTGSETSSSDTVKKGKALKIGLGAAVGTMLFPGAGTLAGVAMGAGSKGKSKTTGQKNISSNQVETSVEKDTFATISLKSLEDGRIYKISFKCNMEIDSKIRCFNFIEEKEEERINVSDKVQGLDGLLKLKELLDIGILTQEEFDKKKQELLNV